MFGYFWKVFPFRNTLAVLALLSLSPLLAFESLMFTPEEIKAIHTQRHVQKLQNHRKEGCLICNGILYINDKEWTVWLNEKLYSRHLSRPYIKIHKVTSHDVNLTWCYKEHNHLITLQTNTGYDGETSEMIK
jgi:hypothetical protein